MSKRGHGAADDAEAGSAGGQPTAGQQQAVSDYLEFTPLGSGSEVGRSCHLLRYGGYNILLDCGIHPAYTGIAALPFFDSIDPSTIDLLLVTHFHLDHAAALPYFLTKTAFKGKCYMTYPTKSVYKLILQDYIKVTSLSVEDQLYSEKDLLHSMSMIETINYHQVVQYRGIKFCAYNAGHVLGAAMFQIEVAGIRILYTGDYSRKEDRHLMAAEIPDTKPDVLIVEATYGVQTLQPIAERERRFTEVVRDIVSVRKGKVLLPAFALGRAQEVLLILDEFWSQHPSLHSIPIYFASALARKCMAVYQTYLNMMNKKIQRQATQSNPFVFRHIKSLRGIESYEEHADQPCVILASPGMLQNGLSRELLELWCHDPRNGCVITGYSVEGTLAKHIMSEPDHITSMTGQKLPFRMSVNYISFSAHADYSETREFVDILRPSHVVLVHGEATEGTGRLMEALNRRYANDGGSAVRIVAPKNVQTVSFEFRKKVVARVVGQLAQQITRQPQLQSATDDQVVAAKPEVDRVSGLLIRRDYQYTYVSTEELNQFTPLAVSDIRQSLIVPYHQTWEALKYWCSQMYVIEEHESTVDVEEQKTDSKQMKDEADAAATAAPPRITICKAVVIIHTVERTNITLEWQSTPMNDMIADSLISLIASIESNPVSAKLLGVSRCTSTAHRHTTPAEQSDNTTTAIPTNLIQILQAQFGPVKVNPTTGDYHLTIDAVDATINVKERSVECSSQWLKQRIVKVMQRAYDVVQPIQR